MSEYMKLRIYANKRFCRPAKMEISGYLLNDLGIRIERLDSLNALFISHRRIDSVSYRSHYRGERVVVIKLLGAKDFDHVLDLIPPNWILSDRIADENKLSSKSTLPTTKGVDDSNDQEKLQKDSRETEKEGF